MAVNYEFYEERADAAADAAKKATLDNVRDRELRSEQAWRLLASRAKPAAMRRKQAQRVNAGRNAAEE
ncbi:MAG: hypothetical protein AB7U34_07030 [Novosphingobium sp.]